MCLILYLSTRKLRMIVIEIAARDWKSIDFLTEFIEGFEFEMREH